MTSSALVVQNLSARYGAARALENVSFSLATGQAIAVLGANGAGKSTLARTIGGLVPASQGAVVLHGRDITSAPAYARRREGLVYLPEERAIFPGLSVRDNLRMATNIVGRAERKQAFDRVLDLFPALRQRQAQIAGSLSGGEQQMLALARGLAVPPKLIVADEMSLGLAPKMVEAVFGALDQARLLGVSIVLIEQFVNRALAFCDTCVLLRRGTVAWSGRAADAHNQALAQYM